MDKRRVVITGLGEVAPNGIGKEEFWQANINGKSGVDKITDFDVSNLDSKIGAQVKNFDPVKFMPKLLSKKIDRFTQFGIAASKLAIEDSKLDLNSEDRSRFGVSIGTGLGGMMYHEKVVLEMERNKFSKVDPLSVPKVTSNAVSGNVAIIFCLTGPNITPSTACSSGAHGVGQAYDLIKLDRADIMIAGGAESPITPFTLCTFNALKVLSKHNDCPNKASRPFDKTRDGFVLGEGAGILVLEELNHALKRNAHIYAEIVGYGMNASAFHMVIPLDGGEDAASAMILALREANIKPTEVDYINAHGTSTQSNDKSETQAIKKVFGGYAYKIPISSTKSMIGHTIGAAGAIEILICVLVIENSLIPPTINYKYKDPDCDLDYVPNETRSKKVNIALSNSFGFGGNNVAIITKKFLG